MNRDPILLTAYGPQPLSRMIRYYRNMAATPNAWASQTNRAVAYSCLRNLIRRAREMQA